MEKNGLTSGLTRGWRQASDVSPTPPDGLTSGGTTKPRRDFASGGDGVWVGLLFYTGFQGDLGSLYILSILLKKDIPGVSLSTVSSRYAASLQTQSLGPDIHLVSFHTSMEDLSTSFNTQDQAPDDSKPFDDTHDSRPDTSGLIRSDDVWTDGCTTRPYPIRAVNKNVFLSKTMEGQGRSK
jgi:hypothetical protein